MVTDQYDFRHGHLRRAKSDLKRHSICCTGVGVSGMTDIVLLHWRRWWMKDEFRGYLYASGARLCVMK